MKKNSPANKSGRGPSLALVIGLIAGFAFISQANAQPQFVGDDGIAASPRVRAQLEERKARLTIASPALVATVACPLCKDTLVSVRNTNSKGLGARTLMGATDNLVPKHLCPSCDTTIAVTGIGKAKLDVATHKCVSCGSENLACCNMKAGSAVATKGMETRKIEIAPVK